MVFESLIEELCELRKALRSVAVRLRDTVFVIVYEASPNERILGTKEGNGGTRAAEDLKSSERTGRKRDECVQVSEVRKKQKLDSATTATTPHFAATSDYSTAVGQRPVPNPQITNAQANRNDRDSESDSDSEVLGVVDVKVVQFSQSQYVPGNGPDREYLSVLAELIALIRILSQENV